MGGREWGEDGVPNRGGEEKAAVQIQFILLGVFPDGFHSSLPELVGSSLIRLLNSISYYTSPVCFYSGLSSSPPPTALIQNLHWSEDRLSSQ